MTKYRLVPYQKFNHSSVKMYLQFLYTYKKKTWFGFGDEKEESVWLYVPYDKGYCCSGPLYQHECDSVFDSWKHYENAFCGQEHFICGPISFTKKYPDIEVYFERRRKQYAKYIEEQELQKQAKIIDL